MLLLRKVWKWPRLVYNNNFFYRDNPVNIYELAAQYFINIKIHLTLKKSTSTINAYININMTQRQDRMKHNDQKEVYI